MLILPKDYFSIEIQQPFLRLIYASLIVPSVFSLAVLLFVFLAANILEFQFIIFILAVNLYFSALGFLTFLPLWFFRLRHWVWFAFAGAIAGTGTMIVFFFGDATDFYQHYFSQESGGTYDDPFLLHVMYLAVMGACSMVFMRVFCRIR